MRNFLLLAMLAPSPSAGAFQAVYSDDRAPNVFPPAFEFGGFGEEPGRLNGPRSVAAGSDDRIFVADTFNHRIQVFTLQGKPLAAWGARGSAPSEFLFPRGVAAGPNGEVFVADTGNDRIQVFDARGKFLRGWGRRGPDAGAFQAPVAVSVSGETVCVAESEAHRIQIFSRSGELRKAFGGYGDLPGSFKEPLGAAIGEGGEIYVADTGNHRIQKFDSSGSPLAEWGRWGPHPGFLSSPAGVAYSGGRLYVADSANHRIQVFDRTGAFLSQWGRAPARPHDGAGRLHFPAGIAVSPSGGFTIVCEPVEQRLQVFANGSARSLQRVNDLPWWDDLHLKMHAGPTAGLPPYSGPSLWEVNPPILVPILEQDVHALLCFDVGRRPAFFCARSSGFGRRLGEFNGPGRVVLDRARLRMWVADRLNRRVQVLELPKDDRSVTGFVAGLRTIASFEPAALVPPGTAGFQAAGSSVDAVALHPRGEVYVVDAANGLLVVFDAKGGFLRTIRVPGPAAGRSPRPVDLAFSPDGRALYVVDRFNFRVVVLDEEGLETGAWGRFGGDSADSFRAPAGIATDSDGLVYVTDSALNRVKKFDAKGGFRGEWGGFGAKLGQFQGPESVQFVAPNFILVDDIGNHRGQTFTRDGKPQEVILKGGSSGPVRR
ncbi:MAG: hypothetical protein HY293_13405 [Planctomycetes bacterium]|nr:hypothetical protein [Planctomycetota bacterium]